MVEAQMPEVADWAVERACKLSNAVDKYSDRWGPNHVQIYAPLKALARYIEAHEAPPVDPMLLEARKLVADSNVFRTNNQMQAILDGHAGTLQVSIALAGIERGLALAGRGEGEAHGETPA